MFILVKIPVRKGYKIPCLNENKTFHIKCTRLNYVRRESSRLNIKENIEGALGMKHGPSFLTKRLKE